MGRTIRRAPYEITTKSKYYPTVNSFIQAQFTGICEDKNEVTVDQNSFASAQNVYVNGDSQLISRPPLKKTDSTHIIDEWRFGATIVTLTCHITEGENGPVVLVFDDGAQPSAFWYQYTFSCGSHSFSYNVQCSTENWGIEPKRFVCMIEGIIFAWLDGKVFKALNLNTVETWVDADKYLYVPVTEQYINGIKSSLESENFLTGSYKNRYVYSDTSDVDIANLISKDITVILSDSDGLHTLYTKTVDANELLSFVYPLSTSIHPEYHYSARRLNDGRMIFLASRDVGTTLWISYNGVYWQEISPPVNCIYEPQLTQDGTAIVAFTGLYYYTYDIGVSDEWSGENYPYEDAFTNSIIHDVEVIDKNNFAVLYTDKNDSTLRAWQEYNGISKFGVLNVTDTAEKHIIRMSKKNPYLLYAVPRVEDSIASLYVYVLSGTSTGSVPWSVSTPCQIGSFDTENPMGVIDGFNLCMHDSLGLARAAISYGRRDDLSNKYYSTCLLNITAVGSNYTCELVQGRSTYYDSLDNVASENISCSYSMAIFEDAIYYNGWSAMPLSERTWTLSYPLFGDDTGIYGIAGGTLLTSDPPSGDLQLFLDVLHNGTSNKKTPSFEESLVEYHFIYDGLTFSSLYSTITKRDDEQNFLIYLPIKNAQNLSFRATGLLRMSDTQLTIFDEETMWYMSTTTLSDGTLLYTKPLLSKSPIGLRDGGEACLMLNGQSVVFATKRGIAVMSPQDFVATTEPIINYISDNIEDSYLTFWSERVPSAWRLDATYYKPIIGLATYRHWIFFYKKMSTDFYMFDTRNSSWWYMRTQYPIRKIVTGEVLEFLLDIQFSLHGQVLPKVAPQFGCKFILKDFDVFGNDAFPVSQYYKYYCDDLFIINGDAALGTMEDGHATYGNAYIEWFFTSQRLHFNAINNYKAINSLAIIAKGDNPFRCLFSTKNFREKSQTESAQWNEVEVDDLRTFLIRKNVLHLTNFQYRLDSEPEDMTLDEQTQGGFESVAPLRFNSITIKYEIKEAVR